MSIKDCMNKYFKLLRFHRDPVNIEERLACNRWSLEVNRFMLATKEHVQIKPLVIIGDDITLFKCFIRAMGLYLGCERVVGIETSTEYLLEGKPSENLVPIEENLDERLCDYVVINDTNRQEYDCVVDRYKDRRTNVLIFASSQSYPIVSDDNRFTVLLSTPLKYRTVDIDIESFKSEYDLLVDKCTKRFLAWTRPSALILRSHETDRINKWFKKQFTHLNANSDIIKYHLIRPELRRLDVTPDIAKQWINDPKSMIDYVCEYNLIVCDYNRLSMDIFEKLDELISMVDISGACKLCFIIPYDYDVMFIDNKHKIV